MLDYVKKILTGQFEAALCMMDHCLRACPQEHWEGKIANGTFRWVAYHTLFWVDLYLSPGDEDAFVLSYVLTCITRLRQIAVDDASGPKFDAWAGTLLTPMVARPTRFCPRCPLSLGV